MRFVRMLALLCISFGLCSSCSIPGMKRAERYYSSIMLATSTRAVSAMDDVTLNLQTLKAFEHAATVIQQAPIVLDTKLSSDHVSSVRVLVNKSHELPKEYRPSDLVYPKVPFIFDERVDKRKLRREAASALEQLVAGARQDGIYLAGVSAYRSHAAQTTIYHNYVRRYGEKHAASYCAEPGHSEHKTGLAVDLTRSDGKCAAEDCFAQMREAKWLQAHAHEYGYIVRYPKGKEHITGYQYEPWHIRYVGKELSMWLTEQEITLEEYYDSSYPYWTNNG